MLRLCILFLSLSVSLTWALSSNDDDWECDRPQSHCKRKNKPFLSHISKRKLKEKLRARHGKIVLFGGGAWLQQGVEQDIMITDGIADSFSVNSKNFGNGIVGVGGYLDALELKDNHFTFQYTGSIFVLPSTTISGLVTQEGLVSNLSYRYSVTYLPSFVGLKFTNKPVTGWYHATIDVGLGVDTIFTQNFQETSLTPYTVPDTLFSDNTSYSFAATVGFGLKVRPNIGAITTEIGYRFFYLGQGNLAINNMLVKNALQTGYNYANALICTVEIG